jgi:hypothetical protein
MGKIVVDSASFTLEVDAPVIGIPPVLPISLTVSSGNSASCENKAVAINEDMLSQPQVTIGYMSSPFDIPGVLLWDGKLNDGQESTKVIKDGKGVIVDDTTSGSITWNLMSPAINPATGVPDAKPSYTGKWNLIYTGQSKATTSE